MQKPRAGSAPTRSDSVQHPPQVAARNGGIARARSGSRRLRSSMLHTLLQPRWAAKQPSFGLLQRQQQQGWASGAGRSARLRRCRAASQPRQDELASQQLRRQQQLQLVTPATAHARAQTTSSLATARLYKVRASARAGARRHAVGVSDQRARMPYVQQQLTTLLRRDCRVSSWRRRLPS